MRICAPFLLAASLAACHATPGDDRASWLEIDAAWTDLEEGRLVASAQRMDALLARTQAKGSAPLPRFWAAFVLAETHARAAVNGAFVAELSSAGRIGAIGAEALGARAERPSPLSHLVASVYHAGVARALAPEAARADAGTSARSSLPAGLRGLSPTDAQANLQVLVTCAYHRLGFQSEVARALEGAPELLRLEDSLAFLERVQVLAELRAWFCAAVFAHLTTRNEREAYRFGVIAVEGQERFGSALPGDAIQAIEDWIVEGASVMFVDPRSQTPYLRGQRRSPISGVPHLEYVAVERIRERSR